MRFHHNLVDNFNDDGIEPGPKKARQDLYLPEQDLPVPESLYRSREKTQSSTE